jgi:hypothetical protein
MTNLVDGPLFLARKISLRVDGLFFEEEAYFVTRRKEVVVTNVVIFVGGEFGLREG